MIITLHRLDHPKQTIEVDTDKIVDMRFAFFGGGSILYLNDYKQVEVDENPNHVGLLAGWLKGNHICVGSKSGMYCYETTDEPPTVVDRW